MQTIRAWRMHQAGRPMRMEELPRPDPGPEEVVLRVTGCGVCHTDLGFFYEGVRTAHPVPLTLGHEISGIVEETGSKATRWAGKAAVVPAVLPCGQCELCHKGRATICRGQQMPGNHIDGGFASHVVLPARHLCPVEVADETTPFGDSGVTLCELSVVADAVTTPLQAIRDSGLTAGEVAVFVGVGGIGGFGVQIAKALGAVVVAIDVDERRLERMGRFGAGATFNAKEMNDKEIRAAVREFVRGEGLSPIEWKIFECSGTTAGQRTAFGLLTYGATLGVIGFTMERLELRLSNLMAFGARAIGNWGCDPRHYPDALSLVERGRVRLEPFVQRFPLAEINSVFDRLHRRGMDRRPILVPDL